MSHPTLLGATALSALFGGVTWWAALSWLYATVGLSATDESIRLASIGAGLAAAVGTFVLIVAISAVVDVLSDLRALLSDIRTATTTSTDFQITGRVIERPLQDSR